MPALGQRRSLYSHALFILICSAGISGISSLRCCQEIPKRGLYSSCKDACDSLWMSSGPLQQLEKLPEVYQECSSNSQQLNTFWQCIHSNYQVISDMEAWEGRACCELATTSECRLSCQRAGSMNDLELGCDATQDEDLLACARRQAGSTSCCRNIDSLSCQSACHSVFIVDQRKSASTLDLVRQVCTEENFGTSDCVNGWTRQQSTPSAASSIQSLHCCDKGATVNCRQTCVTAITSIHLEENVKMENLMQACGSPISEDPLWKCFLLADSASNQITDRSAAQRTIPVDGATIQCCSQAHSSSCRTLCVEMYNKGWGAVWDTFSSQCQYNPQEADMVACIQEVEEPCQLGCEQLDFCSNFNMNVDHMYRTCSRTADDAASKEYNRWYTTRRIQWQTLSVPIRDVTTCQPDMWKAISCSLHIKPCHPQSHSNKLCKSDCMLILGQCVDDSEKSYDIDSLCDLLPISDDPKSCVPLSTFVGVSTDITAHADDSNPCMPNPCNSSQICHVNRDYPSCSDRHPHCQRHKCVSSCKVGESSPLSVRVNYHVSIPDLSTSSAENCKKTCKCGHFGFLTQCKSAGCARKDSCYPNLEEVIDHGGDRDDACNQCRCHSGDLICSRRTCNILSSGAVSVLPCGCQALYHPVCTNNGRVFANPCLAQCAGYPEGSYDTGNCASRNPCGGDPCSLGFKCIPDRKVCLDSSKECPQHQCISAQCNTSTHGTVCDTIGMPHPNICTLLARRRQLGYHGRCRTNCAHYRAVCGVDGETYTNECTAIAARVAVDYHKHCSSLPVNSLSFTTGGSVQGRCSYIECTRDIPNWCEPFIPPGSCCPVCGSMLRVLYSISAASAQIEQETMTPTLVAEHLHNFVSTLSCDLFTHVSIDQELVILVLPTTQIFTETQVKMCQASAQRIHNLIESRSPLMTTDTLLSALLKSQLYASNLYIASALTGASHISAAEPTVLTLTLLVYMTTR